MVPCPLIFEPMYRPKIWGGRNLERLFGRVLPPGKTIGESWDCADLDAGQSVVARGPAKGRTLRQLVAEWGSALLGRAKLLDGQFPLLIKFLDACQDLSVQVHPPPDTVDAQGRRPSVKNEAWYILDAAPGAAIYRGLAPGITVEALAQVLTERPEAAPECLRRIPVKPGEVYYLPSGTVHALGAGVVVAEVQTPSDVTYRLYDWGRVRPGADAGLHVEQGLACIRTGVDFAAFEQRSHVASVFTTVTRLVACPSFIIEKVRFAGQVEMEIPYAECVCWIVLEGSGEIYYGPPGGGGKASGVSSGGGAAAGGASAGRETFARGEVVILPAGLEQPRLKTLTDCVWLEVTIPAPSDLAEHPRPDAASLRQPSGSERLVQIGVGGSRGKSC